MQEDKFCDKCGHRNGPTATKCSQCSQKLPEKRGGTARIVPTGKRRKPDKKLPKRKK